MADRLGAFVEVLADDATPQAAGAKGRLAGVALAVKDMIDIVGRSAAFGLPRALTSPATQSAELITRLRQEGADIVAITQMTALAFEPSGANRDCGRPLNPWSFEHICGGSSSGSAVAVASGCVPLALGSDTAGSLRIPAHCCGITAWKPTYGLVPLSGTMPLAPSLDTIGFLARTARQILPVAELYIGASGPAPIRRLAIARDLAALSFPDARDAIDTMERTTMALGLSHQSLALEPLLHSIDPVVLRLLQAEAARSNAALLAAGALEPALAERLRKGTTISNSQCCDDRAFLTALAITECTNLFAHADAVLLPVMAHATPRVAQCEPSSPEFSGRTLYALSSFTRFVNALGWPAVALPAGFAGGGLPIGLQLVGPPGSDLALLELADRIQATSDWHSRVPTCSSALGVL